MANLQAMAQCLLIPSRGVVVARARLAPSASERHLQVPASLSCTSRSPRLLNFQLNAVPGSVLGVEPDIEEDYRDLYMTAGEDTEDDFPYGKADGAHTWKPGKYTTGFIEGIQEQIEEAGGPATNPLQNAISWLFLPVVFALYAFGVEEIYMVGLTVLFIFAFIGIEMAKPDKPHHLEPEIARLDRDMQGPKSS